MIYKNGIHSEKHSLWLRQPLCIRNEQAGLRRFILCPAAEQFTHCRFSDRDCIVVGAAKHISGKMMCWPISSCALWSPGRTGSGVRRGQKGIVKTSGSMFSRLLRDPQRLRQELYMFSQVDISVAPQWRGKRDLNALSGVLFSVQLLLFFPWIHFDGLKFETGFAVMNATREAG